MRPEHRKEGGEVTYDESGRKLKATQVRMLVISSVE